MPLPCTESGQKRAIPDTPAMKIGGWSPQNSGVELTLAPATCALGSGRGIVLLEGAILHQGAMQHHVLAWLVALMRCRIGCVNGDDHSIDSKTDHNEGGGLICCGAPSTLAQTMAVPGSKKEWYRGDGDGLVYAYIFGKPHFSGQACVPDWDRRQTITAPLPVYWIHPPYSTTPKGLSDDLSKDMTRQESMSRYGNCYGVLCRDFPVKEGSTVESMLTACILKGNCAAMP